MAANLILNALGCLTVLTLVSACSSKPATIDISARPVDKPELVLPDADPISARDVEWTVVTPDNIDEVFQKLSNEGRPVVFFALTDKGYENLSLNLNDLRTFIEQQNTIIAAYQKYYVSAEQALEEAVVLE